MVPEAVLAFKNEGKCSLWASSSQNFACGACNGYVTVRKRSVFGLCLGGAGPQTLGEGGHLTRDQKHSARRSRADGVTVKIIGRAAVVSDLRCR